MLDHDPLQRHRNQRRDIVAWIGTRRHTIMEVQLAHGRGIGPARPLSLHPDARRQSEERRPMGPRVSQRHDTSRGDRLAIDSTLLLVR